MANPWGLIPKQEKIPNDLGKLTNQQLLSHLKDAVGGVIRAAAALDHFSDFRGKVQEEILKRMNDERPK